MNAKIIFILLVAGIATIVTAGCVTTSDPTNIGTTATHPPIDYGNGVLYFPDTEAEFANSLSAYLERNPDMIVVAIAGDDNKGYGADEGYFVIVEKRTTTCNG